MKYVILLLCAGCATATPSPEARPPEVPVCPKPAVAPPCADQLILLNEESLIKGFTCPDGSRTAFPSYYGRDGKVLVLCQCK